MLLNSNTHYSLLEDEKELEWFFYNLVKPLNYNESYCFELVSRLKGINNNNENNKKSNLNNSSYIHTEILTKQKDKFTFNLFKQCVYSFNFDKRYFLNENNEFYPDDSLVLYFNPNPCNIYNCTENLMNEIKKIKNDIIKFYGNSTEKLINLINENKQNKHLEKSIKENIETQFWKLSNIDKKFKNLHLQNKSQIYYHDFDIDIPNSNEFKNNNGYNLIYDYCINNFEKGNFYIINTFNGYHILINKLSYGNFCSKNKGPKKFCIDIKNIVFEKIKEMYKDEYEMLMKDKFECKLNDDGMGIPLPGTLQYGRLVIINNKKDFLNDNKE